MAGAVQHKSKVEEEKQALLDALAEVGGKLTAEEDIIFQGTKLVIPERMDAGDAMRFLGDKIEEDERHMTFNRTYRFRPWDGAYAAMNAMKKAFGMVQQKGVRGMFGVTPPALITINTGPHTTEQVPWGNLEIPMLPGVQFLLGTTRDKELGTLFEIQASGPRKFRHHIEGVFRLVEDELRRHSIYRGKAFDGQEQPDFLDTEAFDETKVIYAKDVLDQLEANVWSLMRYSKTMREHNIPLKRATLFEGPYGTGKTLGAYITAKVAVQNGWTFLYCRPSRDDFAEVMATARLYQPSCVFFEDVDNIASGETPGDDSVSKLLDIFDGINAKGTEIMVVLTTNHADRIHKGMVRPGRLDAVVHIGAPDADGVERFVRVAIQPDLLDSNMDWDAIGKAMDEFYPAFITESIDRAKRYNIARNNGRPTVLSTEDFVQAAEGLRPQLLLMEGAPETPPMEALDVAFRRVANEEAEAALNGAIVRRNDGTNWATLAPEGSEA
jgi:transitional endoplasmic reticulum ATPase